MIHNNKSRSNSSRPTMVARLGLAAVGAWFFTAPALSNPVNPFVVNGSASFNQVGNVLTVTNSNGAIINWQQFNIDAGQTTRFIQASASSSVLNRVLAADPSVILGNLTSNGRVWLVNPAGIFVGRGARIDAAGFVASTLNVTNADFLAGRHLFVGVGTARNVVNQGEISTPAGGSVYLIGGNVSNESIIITPQGETILAAGTTVSLIDTATPGVKVDITGAEGNVTNLGLITAEAGRIGIAGVIVRNSGILNASSVVSDGGRIFLTASQDAYVDAGGRIVTTGIRGGNVEVLGNRVSVTDNAEIDASGSNGGGRIMIGGDYQGKNPEIRNASISYFGPAARLRTDATEVGDGGTVTVWADDATRAYGNISARGGALGGDGGLVATSGLRYLDFQSSVDTGAPHGRGGTLLLDPENVALHDINVSGSLLLNSGNIALHNVAMPVNPVVVSGSASFNQAGGVLTVTSSNGAIINWEKFSIQPGESTRFQQASASSVVINRILGEPTVIYGKLKSSSGRVWLVNPAGVMVGPAGRIDVADYAGKTLNVNNTEFHAARLQIINDSTFKTIVNQSQFTTPVGGGVYLIGKEGTAPVPGSPLIPGTVVSLIDSSAPGVKVEIIGANGGNLNATAITAAALRNGIAGVLVRNSGSLGALGGR